MVLSYKKEAHEILIQSPPNRDCWTHYCFYRQLKAEYNSGEVNLSLIEPIISGTEWQGAAIQEEIQATIYVDDQEAGMVEILDGQVAFDLELLPGTHIVRITAPNCQDIILEVVV
jgi:hypothetical protein